MTEDTMAAAPEAGSESKLIAHVLLVAACVGAAAAALLWSSAPPNHDNAWWLLVTDRVLSGAVFGRDIIEPNPPLFLLVTVPPAAVARVFQLDPHTLYCLWIGAIVAVSGLASMAPLQALGLPSWRAALCVCGFVAIETMAIGRDFGQREAVMVALSAPFILNETARALAGWRPRMGAQLVAAAFAALGFLIKPFFAAVPAGFVLLRVVKERNLLAAFSPPYVLMLLIAVAYASVIVFLTPEWFALVPDIASAHPAAFNSIERLMDGLSREAVLVAAGAALIWITGGRLRAASLLLLAAGLLFYLGGALQMKGYDYHLAPGRLLLSFAMIVSVAGAPAGVIWTRASKLAAIGVLLFLLLRGAVGAGFLDRDKIRDDELAWAVQAAEGGPFMTISPLLTGTFPQVTELGAEWAARTGSQWMAFGASAMLRSDDAETLEEGERLSARAASMLAEDIERERPAVVAVVRADGPLGERVDWLQFMQSTEAFARAWEPYCLARETSRWRIYRRCR